MTLLSESRRIPPNSSWVFPFTSRRIGEAATRLADPARDGAGPTRSTWPAPSGTRARRPARLWPSLGFAPAGFLAVKTVDDCAFAARPAPPPPDARSASLCPEVGMHSESRSTEEQHDRAGRDLRSMRAVASGQQSMGYFAPRRFSVPIVRDASRTTARR